MPHAQRLQEKYLFEKRFFSYWLSKFHELNFKLTEYHIGKKNILTIVHMKFIDKSMSTITSATRQIINYVLLKNQSIVSKIHRTSREKKEKELHRMDVRKLRS